MKMFQGFLYCLLGLAILLSSCKKDDFNTDEQRKRDDAIIQQYLTEKNLSATKTDMGIYYYKTDSTSNANPVKGDTVEVHYVGNLLYGQVFDSSRARNEPFEFVLGNGTVITGWELSVPLLKKGERGVFIIPSYLGYGARATGSIPANSILVFDIELLDFR